MAKQSTLTEQQLKQIYDLKDEGKSERQIAAALGLTPSRVHTALSIRGVSLQQKKVAALVSEPTVTEARKTVFDIMARLEECLVQIENLKDAPGVLRDRVAVITEKRQLINEARSTLESIYSIRTFDEFIREIANIFEEQAPGSRQRIFDRLERNTKANGIIGLFAASPTA